MTFENVCKLVVILYQSQYVDKQILAQCGKNILLRWRHNEHDGVSNHRRLDGLLNFCSAADKRKH